MHSFNGCPTGDPFAFNGFQTMGDHRHPHCRCFFHFLGYDVRGVKSVLNFNEFPFSHELLVTAGEFLSCHNFLFIGQSSAGQVTALCQEAPVSFRFFANYIIFAAVMATKKTFEELVGDQPGSVVEQIAAELIKQKYVEIHLEEEDDQQWAIVKIYKEKDDQEMAIRFQTGEKWILQFGYYDDRDEFIELLQPLTPPDIERIPQALQKVMRKVLAGEEGLRVPGNLLSK